MNSVNWTDKPAQAILSLTKMIEINDTTIMWPAVMFSNKRIINEAGLIKIPAISTGTIIKYKGQGTPGGAIMCIQNVFLALANCTINVNKANNKVILIDPVTFGFAKKGKSPNKLPNRIKKNTVNRKGTNFLYFFSPILSWAISLTNKITGSVQAAMPLGALSLLDLY